MSTETRRSVTKVLIANRGEIAVRVIRACRAEGIASVAIYSDADATALHVRLADEAWHVGPAPATESYLDVDAVLAAAEASGADAIHPGYGFLSENAAFAQRLMEAGLTWIGPPIDAIKAMGTKIDARERMINAGVPVVPGATAEPGSGDAGLVAAATEMGLPVLIKASSGGGGKGMRAVHEASELTAAIAGAKREAAAAFSDETVYVEKLLIAPRHVEVQVFADSHGNVVHVGERECSIQRRHQKVIEEAPSPVLEPALREAMGQAAVAAAKAVGYEGAGTVEFMLDSAGEFYFLEMNTRLQVEHPVTELVWGVDLVRAQLRVARGEALPWAQADLSPRGHAIEARIYAEAPAAGFLPQVGTIARLRVDLGPGMRWDSGYAEGDEVGVNYDPMLAKLIAWGPDREVARTRLAAALRTMALHGVVTNRGFLVDVLEHPKFIEGDTHTGFIAEHYPNGWELPVPPRAALVVAGLADAHRRAGGGGGFAAIVETSAPWRGVTPTFGRTGGS